MFAIMLLCAVFGIAGVDAVTADVAPIPSGAGAGGYNEVGGSTAGEAEEVSENLLLDTIDKQIVHIRPYNVKLDTIARNLKDIKNSNSPIVRTYELDVLPITTQLTAAVAASTTTVDLPVRVTDKDFISNEATLILEGIKGYLEDGTNVDPNTSLMLYVVGKNSSGLPICKAINGSGVNRNGIPAIAFNAQNPTLVTIGGTAGSETQISTDAHNSYPTDWEQYLQIGKVRRGKLKQ